MEALNVNGLGRNAQIISLSSMLFSHEQHTIQLILIKGVPGVPGYNLLFL